MVARVEQAWSHGMKVAPTPGMKLLFFRAFCEVATSTEAREWLRDLLTSGRELPDIAIEEADRWRIVARLLALGDPESEPLLESEIERCTRENGIGVVPKMRYVTEASRPDSATKAKYFADYLGNPSLPSAIPEDWIEASLPGLNDPAHSSLTLPLLRPALNALPRLKRERKIFFILAWLKGFIGGQTSREALEIIDQFLASPPLDDDLAAKVREASDELRRTVGIILPT